MVGDATASTRILVVEDDPAIGDPLEEGLVREGFAVVRADNAAEALGTDAVDFVLLDLGLPDLDGHEVCRRIRAGSDVPIIVLTARSDELERVLLLEAGADDYVVKPYGFRELVARIRAIQRRVGPRAPAEPDDRLVQDIGPLRLDRRSRRVHVDETEVDLAPKEFDLLSLLAAEPERVRTREEIIEQVWDENWWGSTKTLDVHVSALRRKLGHPEWIATIRGVGYRFDGPR